MPSVEACARWAAPNASLTYRSARLGQRRGELGIVRLLGRMEAQVLEQQHVAAAQLVDGHLHPRPERVARHPHRPPEQLGSAAPPPGAGAARR